MTNGFSGGFSKHRGMGSTPSRNKDRQESEAECRNSGCLGKPVFQNNNPPLKGATIAAFGMPLTTTARHVNHLVRSDFCPEFGGSSKVLSEPLQWLLVVFVNQPPQRRKTS